MSGAIRQVCAFLEQVLARRVRRVDYERSQVRSAENALLDRVQLYGQDAAQLRRAQRPENDGLVQAVHEFRGELAASCLDTRTGDLVRQVPVNGGVVLIPIAMDRREPHPRTEDRAHLRGA